MTENTKLTDKPRKLSKIDYDNAQDKCLNLLKKENNILSVYKFGNTKSYGISDIDFLIIAENNHIINLDIKKTSDSDFNYIFKHNLFGICQNDIKYISEFSYLKNLQLLYGNDILPDSNHTEKTKFIINKQIASEYLLRAYISLSIQLLKKCVKTRSLLLNLSALKLDLQLLNISNASRIYLLIDELIKIKENWFILNLSELDLINTLSDIRNELEVLLREIFKNSDFYHLIKRYRFISRDILLKSSSNINSIDYSLKIPFFKNNIINIFLLPNITGSIPQIILERFKYLNNSSIYNKKYLQKFLVPGYIIKIF